MYLPKYSSAFRWCPLTRDAQGHSVLCLRQWTGNHFAPLSL